MKRWDDEAASLVAWQRGFLTLTWTLGDRWIVWIVLGEKKGRKEDGKRGRRERQSRDRERWQEDR